MKKLFLYILLAASGMAAHAQTISPASVASECARQMALGICTVRPDPSSVKPGDTMLLSGVGRVQMSAYMDYMDKFNEANPTDTSMCALALEKMTASPGGDHDLIARALWTPNDMETMEEFLTKEAAQQTRAKVGAAFLASLALFGVGLIGVYIRQNKPVTHA